MKTIVQLLFITCLLLTAGRTHAQTVEWISELPNGNYDIVKDANENIYATGTEKMIQKYNSKGDLLWTVDAIFNSYFFPFTIRLDDEKNIYISGTYGGTVRFGNDSLVCKGYSNGFLAKFDSTGSVIWAKNLEASNCSATQFSLDKDGNIYIAGGFSDTLLIGGKSFISAGSVDIFVTKLNKKGDVIWTKQGGGNNYDDSRSISCVDGNIYIAGIFTGDAVFGKTTLSGDTSLQNTFLWKMDSSGSSQYEKMLTRVSINAMKTDKDNNLYVTGSFAGTVLFDNDTLRTANPSGEVLLVKFDANGTETWAAKSMGNNYANSSSLLPDNNGNCYITGGFFGTEKFDSIRISSSGEMDIFIVEYNSKGKATKAKSYGGPGVDVGASIIPGSDGSSVYLNGSIQNGPVTFDSHTLNGNFSGESILAKLSGFSTTAVEENEMPLTGISIFPNPSAGSFHLSISSFNHPELLISVRDISGRLVYSGKMQSAENKMDITGLKKGFYILTADDGTSSENLKCIVSGE